jgi:hypothetical protein
MILSVGTTKVPAEGAKIETTVYLGARHGFDSGAAYDIPTGENHSCSVYKEQPDGTWKERTSGLVTHAAGGRVLEASFKRALAKCRTFGVNGRPDAVAKAVIDLKSYVQRHLIERN